MLGTASNLDTLPLWPSQRGATARALRVLQAHRGVLLCLPTGFGKTFVACALAALLVNHDPSLRVVALVPARLKGMWERVAATFHVSAEVRSHREASLQRLPPPSDKVFWVVDEAHGFRKPETLAYRAVAQSLRLGLACLLTATPVQTDPSDLLALLALLPLTVEPSISAQDAASRLVVSPSDATEDMRPLGLEVQVHTWHPPPLAEDIATPLLSSLKEAFSDAPLVLDLMLSRLSSHPTAWLQTVHRLLRALPSMSPSALGSVFRLDAPTQMLLPFGEVFGPKEHAQIKGLLFPSAGLVEALGALGRQRVDALDQALRRLLGEPSPTCGAGCLLFSQFSDTASHIARSLRQLGWSTALITGQDARLGPSRCDPSSLLEAWSATPSGQRPSPQVLVCTDVLSLGQNLQRAQVLGHLDLPWNPAIVLQRHGRVLRPGQQSSLVHIGRLCSPAPLDQWAERQRARTATRLHMVASAIAADARTLALPQGLLHSKLLAQRAALLRALKCAAFPLRYHASAASMLARIARLEHHLDRSPLCAGQSMVLSSLTLCGAAPELLEAAEAALLTNPKE